MDPMLRSLNICVEAEWAVQLLVVPPVPRCYVLWNMTPYTEHKRDPPVP